MTKEPNPILTGPSAGPVKTTPVSQSLPVANRTGTGEVEMHPSHPLVEETQALEIPQPIPVPGAPAQAFPNRWVRLLAWVQRYREWCLTGTAVVVLLVCGFFWFHRGWFSHGPAHNKFLVKDTSEKANSDDTFEETPIAVKTIHPQKKTLVRTLTLPGTVRPFAQAELYAKVSGYLGLICREQTPHMLARIIAATTGGTGDSQSATGRFATLAVNLELANWFNPQKDIGSVVEAGELLMEIAVPELQQDIVKKRTMVLQREAELEEARTAMSTLEAQVKSAEAHKEEVEAEILKAAAEHTYRTKQLQRLEQLVKERTITADNLDEKQHQVESALAAWKSSKAKLQTAQANILAVSSKLATARAEIRVKELLVRAAQDELRSAEILADYVRVYAPFRGVITYRGVDEGDFVQNSTTGQTRILMTVTAIDKVKIVLQVPEQEAAWVEPGTEAVVQLEGRLSFQRKGWVTRLSNALDPQSRTMQVEIDLDNQDYRLKPGMYGQVTLLLQQIPNAFALPASAIYSRKGKNYVIQVEDGIAHYHPVRLRYDDGLEVEAVRLVNGKEIPMTGQELVVASNTGEIRDGQRIAVAH